jgi:hypothetical protein
MYNVTLRRVRVTTFAVKKTISITQVLVLSIPSVSIVVLFTLHGKRMHRMILSCHLCPLWLYHIFPHYLRNGTIF